VRADYPPLPGGFGRAECALLEPVVKTDWHVYLLDAKNAGHIMNAPDHGLHRAQLTDRLFDLWHNDWIECLIDDQVVAPSLSILKEQFAREGDWPPDSRPLFYRLGAIGGAVWESLTVLDWAKFVSRTLNYPPGGQRWQTLASPDLDVLKLVFTADRLGCGLMPGVIRGTERWSETHPWRATYWKTLPVVAYQVEVEWDHQHRPGPFSEEEWVLYETIRRELPERTRWRKSFEEVCAEHFLDSGRG